jgi:hypothetical protein
MAILSAGIDKDGCFTTICYGLNLNPHNSTLVRLYKYFRIGQSN